MKAQTTLTQAEIEEAIKEWLHRRGWVATEVNMIPETQNDRGEGTGVGARVDLEPPSAPPPPEQKPVPRERTPMPWEESVIAPWRERSRRVDSYTL